MNKYGGKRLVVVLLCVSNILCALVLLLMFHRYQVFEKVKRRILLEKRTPFQDSFKVNRNFAYYRDVFASYPLAERQGVIIGDSQVSAVSWNEFMPEYNVGAQGIPGDTSAGVHYRISDCYRWIPKWIAVLIGTNDVLQGRGETTVANFVCSGYRSSDAKI